MHERRHAVAKSTTPEQMFHGLVLNGETYLLFRDNGKASLVLFLRAPHCDAKSRFLC